MRAKQFVPIVEAIQELFEVKMSPGNLKKLASQIDAKVGIEFEMIVPDVGSVDGDESDPEEDMSMDESAVDIDDIIRFFDDGDYNDRSMIRDLREELQEKFYEWQSEQVDEYWNSSDGKEFFVKWCRDNVSDDEVADYAETPEDLLGDRVPSKEDWENFIEGQWDEGFSSDNYQNAYDEFREDRIDNGDFDERDFLRSIGIYDMSDVQSSVRTHISWPHWSYPDGDGEYNLEQLADEFSDVIGRKVHYSTGYHGGPRTNDAYTIEPDSSLSGSGDDAGLEFISPPLPIDEALEDVKKIKDWADDRGVYTNRSTGLHMNVSVPGFDPENLDFVKLTLLLGDKYLLDRFGRSANTYCKSAMDIIAEAPNLEDKELLFKKLKNNLETIASRVIHSGRVGKFTSINPKDNRVEFRGPGGDWLGQNLDKIEDTLYRCVVALDAAVDPDKYRKEYLKKLTKMFAPTKGSLEDVFMQYQAGTITREELKFKLKTAQTQRKQQKLSKEGVVEVEFYQANDGDYIIEYDNPTGDTRRIFLKRTEQVDDPNKAVEAAMKLEPSWFKPDDIENIIVTEFSGNKEYAVLDSDGDLINIYRALTPLQAIDIAMSYNDDLPKDKLTVKLASEYQPPAEQEIEQPNQEFKLYKVSESGRPNVFNYVAARSVGEARRIALTIYPGLSNDVDIVLQDASRTMISGYQARQQEMLDDLNNRSSTQEFFVSNPRTGQTIQVRTSSENRARELAIQNRPDWTNISSDELQVTRRRQPPPSNPNEGMDSYIVSDPGDNAGGARFRANSPEHAIERARQALRIPADRELVARLENG